jgi:4'-phosphopantetheinyl transferase EntD
MNKENVFIKVLSTKEVEENFNKEKKILQESFPQTIKKSDVVFKLYHVARKALLAAVSDMGIEANLDKLDIVNHHYIFPIPGTLCSLSHTKDLGFAAVTKNTNYRSIGIDFEIQDRSIPKGSQKYFKTKEDSTRFSDLELWVLKEACFKCLQPLWKRIHLDEVLSLNDIKVQDDHFYINNNKGELIKGEIYFEYNKKGQDNFYLALALLPL